MKDLREWLQQMSDIGQLKEIRGADPDLEIGIITELNGKRRGPALLFDEIKGYPKGYRLLSGAILNAHRLSLSFGFPKIDTDQAFVSHMEGRFTEYERKSPNFPPREVREAPLLKNRLFDGEVDLLKFPAPKWHEHDGGRYLGTGCVVITRDPDSGNVNFGSYRLMVHDKKTLALHISSAHHGAINLKKYHAMGKPAPIAVSFGHHPLFMVVSGLGLPYATSEYQFLGAVAGEAVPVVRGEVTGLPIPAQSEFAIEGFSPTDEFREEGPFGEYTGYYASGRGKEPILEVEAVYHRDDPIILGAPPGRPPHDYSYAATLMKSVNIKEALVQSGIPDVKGVWYHEAAGVNFFAVVSIRQRYPGHSRQAGYIASQCPAAACHLGRYMVVVDDDIDPSNLEEVIWAIGTRSNPERDIEVMHDMYSSPLDPIYPRKGALAFGSRAIIDACKPFDWLSDFPKVAQSSPEARKKVMEKWKEVFS
jgi:UbiD family decarboxylase